VISDDWVNETRRNLPELPEAKASRFVSQYGIREYDAQVLTDSRSLADYYEEMMQHTSDGLGAANWLQVELLGVLNKTGEDINATNVRPKMLADLVGRIASGEISGKIAKTVFAEMVASGKEPSVIIKEQGLVQISDDSAIIPIIEQVLESSPDNVSKYRSGKTNVFAFFVGQVMKATKGQANPEAVNRLLKERLDS
jgi:aspartyl-tRNA(Asn)/glutamyl-tRNA(Gln) amidotransferase subunit B